MNWIDRLALFAPLDFVALGLVFVAWAGIGWIIEHPPANRPSVSVLMARYRQAWMREMVERNPRVFDSQTLANMRQGTSFFASATMIAIGGALALIGNAERLAGVASELALDNDPVFVWEIKLLVMLAFLTDAFLKFVWSHRLYGYCAVLVAAVPNDPANPVALPRAAKAAEINITAARGFNRGLRAVYFALGSAAWLLGAVPLMLATALTMLVLWRREFASQSRGILMSGSDNMGHTET